MVAQPEGAEVDIGDLERMVAMLERVGDVASAAKHKCTLTERRRKAAEKAYVAPLSQRFTMAHKQAAEVSQKLEKAVAHFERLQEGLEQQRRWVQQLTAELEEREKEHCRLVVELKETYVPPQQAPPQALSVAGILDGTIESIPLSFAGLGFDDAEYDMEDSDKRELEERTARLQTELAAAVKAMFGQAAEKAKAFKIEQEKMAARLAGKRRRQDSAAAAPGPEAAPAAAAGPPSEGAGAAASAEAPLPAPAAPAAGAGAGDGLKQRAARIRRPPPPQATSSA
jgi:regulator of replication initiation timing